MMKMKPQEIKQANYICRREWNITALAHNLVMLVLAEYKKIGVKLEDGRPCFVKIPATDLLSEQKSRPGGNQYTAARHLVDTVNKANVIIARAPIAELSVGNQTFWDIWGVPIFTGTAKFHAKTQEIECSLNPELYQYWFDLNNGDYTRLSVKKVLQLPLNTTAHLLYQYLMSYKFKGQFEDDMENLKNEIGCKDMDMKNFTRRVLAKYQKEFTEKDILHWEYELVRGYRNKITKIRIVFPEEQKPQADTAKKEKVKSENWGWIGKQDPEVVEMAYEARDNGTYPQAINSLSGILNGTPPEEREQALIEFKAEVESRKHQQVLF